jgi:zinc protease
MSTLAVLLAASLGVSQVPKIPFEKYTLENGLQVILHHDPRLPLVAVSVWYDVGGLHERAGRSGFAHLFEHMMFQGSLDVPEEQHFSLLQQAGASGINGTTDFDRTNYFETVPSHEIELALWLESDRMGYLLPTLTKKSLDNQIDVVKNERRQSIEGQPYGLMGEMIMQTLFPPGHPYHGNVIGSMQDLSAATVEDVRDFFLTYYSPANATLAIAGDFDPATIKGLVQKYFGPLKGRPKPLPPKVAVPAIAGEQLISFEEPVATLPRLSMVWIVPPAYSPGLAELQLLAHVISGTKSARLDARVTFKDQIAQSVTCYLRDYKAGSMFEIDLVTRPGRTLEEARAAIEEVIADLEKNPPTEAELKRAQNAEETATLFGIELLGGMTGRAERLQYYNLYLGDPGKLEWDLERYRKATTADLAKAAQQFLGKNRLIVLATPKGGAQ